MSCRPLRVRQSPVPRSILPSAFCYDNTARNSPRADLRDSTTHDGDGNVTGRNRRSDDPILSVNLLKAPWLSRTPLGPLSAGTHREAETLHQHQAAARSQGRFLTGACRFCESQFFFNPALETRIGAWVGGRHGTGTNIVTLHRVRRVR